MTNDTLYKLLGSFLKTLAGLTLSAIFVNGLTYIKLGEMTSVVVGTIIGFWPLIYIGHPPKNPHNHLVGKKRRVLNIGILHD